MYTSILSATMQGIKAIPVQVEVDVSPGLPGFSMVGTVNSQVREAQDRVRTALHNLEIPVPPRRMRQSVPGRCAKDRNRVRPSDHRCDPGITGTPSERRSGTGHVDR